MAASPKIIVILGPTASGKSALAVALAEKIGGEILSVDSMQVYRGMDIGTAKPTAHDRRRIVHHLLDIADPNETFSVSKFVELADQIIADAARRNIPLIATGGTPLYYKSLFEGLFEGPSADASLRLRLSAEPLESLHQKLQQIDPAAATRIHLNDRRRLIRAIEVFELTGQTISSLQTEWTSGKTRHDAIWIGLQWDRDAINRRINARVKQMIEQGWLDETRNLLARYHELSKTAAEATGYRELIDHLHGKMSLDDAIEQIKIATRQLARRQMKWFRQFKDVNWLKGDASPESLLTDAVRLSLAVSR
ncbi:MAG TPA: tRNA (adenosine(37)-N6)-dimethylallyltransferase MiaA [Tepidisphaeraceae bacterium]|nr:tRNA (adenosine(37)-N6)-dimethylallyltransferase MiaA [Tepidisphaeraceae bacterium]